MAPRGVEQETTMDDLDRFEPGTHTFSGTVRVWATSTAEVVTDSGLVVFLDTRGQPPVQPGARITVDTRKYRPCHFVTRVTMG
jgi:hypothetical protein